MRLADIVNGPWAITPEMYGEVQGIYARHMRGDKIDLASLEASTGIALKRGQARDTLYSVHNGVAVLSVEGVLAKRMNLFMAISGGTSTQMLTAAFNEAIDDPAVNSIVLAIDSPGGTVDGTSELADAIFNARGKKPVIAHADGTMASAAYWIGSAADKAFVADDTTAVGSIGVVATHVDYSGAQAQNGVKTTEITAGKYKRIASQFEPLSTEGRAVIQGQVDYLYSVFVDAVARNRGTDAETVLTNMADGRIFLGRQAIEAGLVDGVSTLSALIERAGAGEFSTLSGKQPKAAAVAGDANAAQILNEKDKIMDINTLKADHPALFDAVHAEGFAAGKAEGVTEGANNERARIQSVQEQALPGHEALIETLKFDGKTSGEQAAVAVLNAERGKSAARLDALRGDGKDVKVPSAVAPEPEAQAAADAPLEERAKAAWDKDANLRAEFGNKFESYLAYAGAHERGAARVKSNK